MKTRTAIVCSCLIGLTVLFVAYEYSWAEAKEDSSSAKIGAVSVQKIFSQCNRNVLYLQQAQAEQEQIMMELDQLNKKIEADKAALKTRKVGSKDYLELMKTLLSKQGQLQAQKEYYTQQIAIKDQNWTQKLYSDILRITGVIAKEKGLDLVVENSQPETEQVGVSELMLTIRTNKVLYSQGCLDITDEVISKLDLEK